MGKRRKVLFVCTGNSCRSQMAEGLLRNLANNFFEVYSAGTCPSRVHPNAITVMKELNIDISEHTSDSIDCYINMGIDIIITVCDHAKKRCPVFPGDRQRIHWNIKDPFDGWSEDSMQLNNFRDTREIIKNYILKFLKDWNSL